MDFKNEEVMVSVICTCFNHEKYIKDALESFVNQKTSFKYEVIVHDDASTDNSAEIIREYEEKYPDIIKPIYQTENQYSQGVKIVRTYMLPEVSGKYIAFCEGDDYWTDENKLQKQVDFLESYPEFSVCVHNTEFEYMNTGETMVRFLSEDREIQFEDIFEGDKRYHTSSILVRKDFYVNRPLWVNMVQGIGDLPSSVYYTMSGRVMYFGDVMSHYRYGVVGSWTDINQENPKKQIINFTNIIKMLKEADKYYDYTKHEIFKRQLFLYRYRRFKERLKQCFPWLLRLKRCLGISV